MKMVVTVLLAVVAFGANQGRTADAVDFARDIKPILEERCLKCHGPEKQKAKLRLDSKAEALKGGKSGVAIVAGDAEKSDLYRRVILPKGDDDIMPNEGEPLTKAQTDLIRDWIKQGANWPEGLVIAAPAAPAPAKEVARPNPPMPLPADFKPSAKEPAAIAALAKFGVEVRPVAMNVPWTEANFRLQGTNITDAALAPVKELTSLVDVNLAMTKVTDVGLANLKGLTNLQSLHLEQTKIADAGLAHLAALPRLHYLNLYGTPVTDAGLEHLKGLSSLRNLYVWQTKVSEAGVTNLKQALTNLAVSTGWVLPPPEKKEAKEPEKKEAEKK